MSRPRGGGGIEGNKDYSAAAATRRDLVDEMKTFFYPLAEICIPASESRSDKLMAARGVYDRHGLLFRPRFYVHVQEKQAAAATPARDADSVR